MKRGRLHICGLVMALCVLLIAPLLSGCFEIGVDYSDANIDKLDDGSVQSAGECQELCRKKMMCFFFSWDSETKACYLKHAFALNGRRADPTTVGIISGPKVCIQL